METYCEVCGQRDSWGCGHTSTQRRSARIHNARAIHLDERCHHYNAPARPGWIPATHSVPFLAAQAQGIRYRAPNRARFTDTEWGRYRRGLCLHETELGMFPRVVYCPNSTEPLSTLCAEHQAD